MSVDRRFGYRNKFGTTNQFGASTLDASLAWALEVDWDGDGLYSGASESLYMCGLSIQRGRRSMLQRTGAGFEVVSPGSATFTLWNDDGRYDGWNAGSPLYPNVTYGKDLRIRVRDLVTGTIQPAFAGVISDIVPFMDGDRQKVNISVDDGLVYLRNYPARVRLQTNISPDTAIGLVLDDAGWPVRWGRNLDDASVDNIRYFWADGDKLAGSEIQDIANAFFGYFFVSAEGQARFVTRTTVGVSEADFDQSNLYKDLHNPQPWVNQRNVMKIKVFPYDVSDTAVLYEYFGDAISIPSGESTSPIFAHYTYNNEPVAALSLEALVETTDYLLNSAADGSGTDVTSLCSVTISDLGTAAKIIVTNGSGATAYITKLNVRGIAVYKKNSIDVSYPADPSAVVQPKLFLMDLPWQQDVNQAVDFCTVIGPFLEGLHPFPTIQLEGNFDLQFGVDLFSIVTLTSSKKGIDGVSFRIGGIEHESLDEGCQRIRTTFYLEPYVGGGTYMEWPGIWGETTIFGW